MLTNLAVMFLQASLKLWLQRLPCFFKVETSNYQTHNGV